MLSKELRALEKKMGVKLLVRHARGMGLTPAGEALRKRAESILSQIDALADEVRQADEPVGRVSLGMPATMSHSVTGPLLRAFLSRYPSVKLRVTEGSGAELRARLLARDLDLALLSAPVAEPQLIVRPVLVEPCMLVTPPGSPFANRRVVSPSDLAGHPMAVPSSPNYTRALIDEIFEKSGHSPSIALETDDSALMIEFVGGGLGYAILPACAMVPPWPGLEGIRHVPIRGVTVTRLMAAPAGLAMSLGTQRLSQMICELIRAKVKDKTLMGEYVGP